MSELLTGEEYSAIAAALELPQSAFIDGRYQAGRGARLATINPATGDVLCEIASCNSDDVDHAVDKALSLIHI